MKILIIGSNEIWSIERLYLKYLKALNTETDLFPAQSIFYEYYQRSIVNKLLFKSGLSAIFSKIDKAARKKIETYQPSVIWVFKGMEINPSLLHWIRQKRIKLVNYNPDNPFIFSGKGSGNKNVTLGIPLYDLHFTYNLHIKKELENRFSVKTAFLPFGFDISEELYTQIAMQPEIMKVCFLGNPDKARAGVLKELASAGVLIDVYGNDWDSYVMHENIKSFKPVYGDDFWKKLRSYRVQINLMRMHNENSHNMRSFEVPAAGGIMLAPDTPEHRIFFEAGKEIFLFTDITQCIKKINYLLALSAESADAVRQLARRRSVVSGYSYHDRAAQALKEMKSLHG
jgi:spore maturation protein CgeB